MKNYELLSTRIRNKNRTKGLSSKCDCLIFGSIKYKINKNIKNSKTYFIKREYIQLFYEKIYPFLKNSIIIIIGSSDKTLPSREELNSQMLNNIIKCKFIKKIFVENLVKDLGKKVCSIPLGMNPKEGPIHLKYYKQFLKKREKIIKFTNFNRTRNGKGTWSERKLVNDLCEKYWKKNCAIVTNLKHTEYLNFLSKYAFTICVHGGGVDPCPKVWEALLLGVIPIIRNIQPHVTAFKGLPVVIIDKWDKSTITKEKLIKWYEERKKYIFDDRLRKKVIKKLLLKYWVKKINKYI